MVAALLTPILLAPEGYWQFFTDYRQFGWYGWFTGAISRRTTRCAVSNLSSRAGHKARPVTDSAATRRRE
jgi:hypothetical protein